MSQPRSHVWHRELVTKKALQKRFKEVFNGGRYQKSKNYVACVDKITDLNARDEKKYQFTKPKKDINLWMLQRLVRTKQEMGLKK